MKLVMICFLIFLSLGRGARAELADFSSPYPKNEHFFAPQKPQEYNQVRKYAPAIIWHAPPIEAQLASPELINSESIDELALNYLLEGCRQENPEFVKIEKKFKSQNTPAYIISKRIIQAGSQQIGSNLISWQDSERSRNQYEHTIRYIKNNFLEFKQFYQAQESYNPKIIESSQSAKRNLEELCSASAVQKVISLYQDL
jgi:hypothetical protein